MLKRKVYFWVLPREEGERLVPRKSQFELFRGVPRESWVVDETEIVRS